MSLIRETAKRLLRRFLHHGERVVTQPELRGELLGGYGPAEADADAADPDAPDAPDGGPGAGLGPFFTIGHPTLGTLADDAPWTLG